MFNRPDLVPREWKILFFFAALLGVGVPWSGVQAESGSRPSVISRSDTLSVFPGENLKCLQRSRVFPSSVQVIEGDSLLVADQDYILDANAGCLTLITVTTLPRELFVSYESLEMDLLPRYQLLENPHRRQTGVSPEPTEGSQDLGFTTASDVSGLEISGSKTFGIELGNRQDLKLRQSLDLRLFGNLTEDTKLLAILSDQDLPFQPEGNTTELAELDRVLLELQTPKVTASLGDIDLLQQGSAFLNFSRRLEGFQGRGTLGSGQQNATLAATKGEFATSSFFGVDGRQGPYRLLDRAGADGVIVVAGSEKVFLDGRLLLRGEEEDYVIDYSLGEITFTSRHLLTANSQITVDYEFSTARYRRGLVFGGGENIPAGPLGSLRAAFFRESDDADNPLGGDLTAAEREQLAALGDSALSVSGGTRYVGPGLGDYLLLSDPETGDDIFVFVDGSGDYQVFFVDVGELRGTYEIDPDLSSETRSVFVFVGEGRGTHVVRRDLPPPQARTVANLRWDLAGPAGAVFLEGAVSDEDRNTLSSLDDNDNDGGAFWFEARGDTLAPVQGVSLVPEVRWRQVSENFSAPGRIRNSFYGRDWNRVGSEVLKEEDLKEGSLDIGWEAWNWTTEVGRLAVADTFRAVRSRQTLRFQDRGVFAQGGYTHVQQDGMGLEDGQLEQLRFESRVDRGGFVPRGKLFSEIRERPGRVDGERFWEWEGALGFPVPKTKLRGELGFGRRLDDQRKLNSSPWELQRDAKRLFFSMRGQVQNLGVDLRYENRDVELPGGNQEERNVGRMDLRHQAQRGAWSANLTMDVGSFGLRQRTKEIVADSTGFFDQFGNYVGAGGGFDVQFSDFGPEVLTSQLNLRNRFRWSPRATMEGLPDWLRTFAYEGFVDLSEASDLPLGAPRYLFSPASYLNRNHTVNGRLRSRQTVDALPNQKLWGLRLVHQWTRSLIRNQGEVGDGLLEISNESEWTATLRSTPASGWTAELEGSRGQRDEDIVLDTDDSFSQETVFTTATARAGRRFKLGSQSGRLSAETSYGRETGEDKRAVGWSFRPRLQLTFDKNARLDTRFSWTRLNERVGFTALRGAGAPRLEPGWRLDIVGDARIRQGVRLTSTLSFNRPEGLTGVTEGRLEVRGSF